MENWSQYNEKLVRRGEIIMSFDVIENWHKEFEVMNHNKRGRKFDYPDSFMKLLGYARVYFGLPFRQTEGMIRAYCNRIPAVPDFTSIHKRVNKLDIKIDETMDDDSENGIILAIDSTGIKVANRGEWMRQKWHLRRGFLKIHVGADVKTKKISSLKITDDSSHDAAHLPELVEQASQKGNVVKVLADGAYDSENNFSYLYHNTEAIPAIKVRKTSSIKTKCHPRKKSVLAQIFNYELWKHSVSYGDRWIVECVFSTFKRMFGEYVMAHKRKYMIKELELKVELYNLFASV